MSGTAHARRPSAFRQLLPLALTLLGLALAVLMLCWMVVRVQVALGAMLNGESLWSKAQKQATIDLIAYAASGDERQYAGFLRNYDFLMSDRWIREQLEAKQYDHADVARALKRAQFMPSAVEGTIFVLRNFGWVPFIRKAVADWSATDPLLDQLKQIAGEIHDRYATGRPDADEITQYRTRIRTINDQVAPLPSSFSLVTAQGLQWSANVIFTAIMASGAVALVLWLWAAYRALARTHRSEERYWLLFNGAPDAIVLADQASGRIIDANDAAVRWLGQSPAQLAGSTCRELLGPDAAGDGFGGQMEVCVRGAMRHVEVQTSDAVASGRRVRQYVIRDVSERIENERARQVAAAALASAAEGMIITDAERRVVSANAAAHRLTGFTERQLAGSRFDATRTLPDGEPLAGAPLWVDLAVRGQWSGDVRSTRQDGTIYTEKVSISTVLDTDARILHYVVVFSDVSAARAAQSRLEHLATRDALTDLANRAEFQRRCQLEIERTTKNGGATAVLFIDLDGFKLINDRYGHAAGDQLLRLVARRICRETREDSVVARVGGDEFAVVVPRLGLREEAREVAARVVDSLARPFRLGNGEVTIGASIGIAGFPLDADDAESLIVAADSAMYAAKREQRNTWRLYTADMRATASKRATLAAELHDALQRGEFRLAYQPTIDVATREIVALEALVRWRHPQRGTIMPDDFIPVAEIIGLVHLIDQWVLDHVCAQIHAWDVAGVPPVRVGVNASAQWFGHPDFVDRVADALQRRGVAPHRIVIEATESTMLQLGAATDATMRALEALGTQVAVDDFGTGYASMAYLKLPAVRYVKIDRSFISGLPAERNDAALVTAMVSMANSLGLAAIAEGVETEDQHRFLAEAGCGEAQGWLYARALEPAAIARMLREAPARLVAERRAAG